MERSKGKGGWGKEERGFYRVRELGAEKEEEMNGGKELEYEEIERKDKEIQKRERWQKIIKSKYNNKGIKEEGMSIYMKGK